MAYPTLQELVLEVKEIIDNVSWTSAKIKAKINETYAETCEHEKVRLPALEAEDDLTTSITLSYIALPTDIQTGRKRAIFKIRNASQNYEEIPIYSSLSVLLSKVPDYDQAGTIVGCAIRGGNLHYQRIPATAETLMVHYWKTVTLMSLDTSTPSHIPSESLARRLMIHGACAKIFPRIYQDFPQTHPMVMEHKSEYERAFKELLSFIGPWDVGFDSFKA